MLKMQKIKIKIGLTGAPTLSGSKTQEAAQMVCRTVDLNCSFLFVNNRLEGNALSTIAAIVDQTNRRATSV